MLEPTDLFDPAHYLDCRRPFEQARTLPRWCYTSQTFHERELSRIFFKTWLLVGREDEIARPGDYMTVDTMGGPVIVLRDGEGEVRAFANTCRHRGARVLAGAGSCGRAMKCAYHGWVYALDGSLIGAPEMERTPGFEKADYGLSPVRHASWEGFIWITFDAEAPTLTSYFGDLTTRFASYRFRDFVVTRRSEYRIASNWKLLIDNALEAYHTTEVHKISLGTQITEDRQTIGNWDAIFLPGHTSVAVLPAETAPFVHVAGLEGDLGHGTYFSVLYPNTLFACVQDCMWWLNLMPEGPENCVLKVGFCFPKETAERPDFETEVEAYYHRWDTGIDEDNATGTLQHVGLRSVLRTPGPYSWHEFAVHRIANWVLDQVLDDGPGLRPGN